MSITRPQHDLPVSDFDRLSGAADAWDDGLAGALVSADFFPSAPTGLTLQADPGAFTYAGTAATLRVDRVLVAEGGVWSFAGVQADLAYGRALAAEGASFAFAGTDAELQLQRSLLAEPGSFAYAGAQATLRKTAGIVAEGGAWSFTGTDATLTWSGQREEPVEINRLWVTRAIEAARAAQRRRDAEDSLCLMDVF